MMPAEARVPQAEVPKTMAERSPMAKLLHALNQPLTGLQCSMEVALVRPRTNEQYVRGLREGLELTERMRALVEAIREVAEVEEESAVELEATELESLLREAAEDLMPVAEVKKVQIALDVCCGSSLAVTEKRSQLARVIFRLLDSALSMAAPGSVLRIENGSEATHVWARMQWQEEAPPSALSRPELGLLIAQAWLERVGAKWQREGAEDRETLTVRLPKEEK